MSTRKSHIHKKHLKKKRKTRKKSIWKKLKCSPKRNEINNKYTCYNSEALYKIRNSWNMRHPDAIIDTNNPKEIWESLKELNSKTCSNEMCWLKQQCMKHDLDKNLVLDNFAPMVLKIV